MSEQPNHSSSEQHPDASPFLFVGDLLALDLVNTAIRVRGKPRELLATPADVADWWAAALRHHPDRAVVHGASDTRLDDPDVREELIRLRNALRDIFSALVAGVAPTPQAVAQLNAILHTGYHALEVTASGAVQPVYHTSDHISGGLLLPVALSAVAWLMSGDRQRLHRCANQRCVLLFYDTTKSATRRWCSVGCMDRARSAQRYRQAKQHTQAQQ